MYNPFKYGEIVSGEDFADRQKEIKELMLDLSGGQNIIIYSQRRFGKTSLILEVLRRLRTKGILTAHVDLFRATSKKRFIEIFADALASGTMGKIEEAIKTIKEILPAIVPKIVVKSEGMPGIEVEFGKRMDAERVLEGLYDTPQRIAEKKGKMLVMVFDEFQEIGNLDGDGIEKEMRSKFQHHDRVSYVFMGSKRHLFEEIFTNKNKPLYNIGKLYPLRKIPHHEFAEFISKKFKDTGFKIEDKIVYRILEITDGHPHYTQQLCHEIWNICLPMKFIKLEDVEKGVKKVMTGQSYAYETVWDLLRGKQKSLLLGLALEGGKNVFSQSFIDQYDLSSPSNVQKAIKSLEKKGIVERENTEFEIPDIFLREWLKQK